MKTYQGKLDNRIHAFAKAQAQIQNMTIPDYINSLIIKDLQKRGYSLEAEAETDQEPERVLS